jgi:ubiquinone/menaquinone biosynthesis C-methylase UbiE
LSNEPATPAESRYKLLPNFAHLRRRLKETRSPEQLIAHYEKERQLSDRLRNASREERRTLYTEAYTQLLAAVAEHPQNHAARPNTVQRVGAQLRAIRDYIRPGCSFLEIGCGDAALACAVARTVSMVYAVDVNDTLFDFLNSPSNLRFLHTNGVSIPLASASIDVAYSNQLMEHLHPADAIDQLKEIYRVLRSAGSYICVTPSRLTGPHDISCYFDYEATCFHLKEYDYGTLHALFQDAGFRQFRCYVWVRGWQIRIPYPVIRTFELLLSGLPPRNRVKLTSLTPVSRILGLYVVGVK